MNEPSPVAPEPTSPRRRNLKHRVAVAARWLHIYTSMFGLCAILFFGVTGLTLNHPDWFYAGAERNVEVEGQLDARWVKEPVAELNVVEHLRARHGVRGAVADFRSDDLECVVAFKGPGYAADAIIDRATGRYQLTETSHGLVAVLNDLHKGRDTGKAWSILIDVSAVLMSFVALTGLVLLLYIKRRRASGLLMTLAGTVVLGAMVYFLVP